MKTNYYENVIVNRSLFFLLFPVAATIFIGYKHKPQMFSLEHRQVVMAKKGVQAF